MTVKHFLFLFEGCFYERLFQETYGIYFLEIETGEIETARKPSLNEDTVEYCLIANIIVLS